MTYILSFEDRLAAWIKRLFS